MNVTMAPALLSGYLLALARATAWVFIAPPFGNRTIPRMVKIGFAAALALVMGPHMAAADVPLETAPFVSAVVLQLAAGAALGYLGVMMLSVIQAAGGLIDLFGGYTMAQLFDPMSNAGASDFGRLYYLLGITILFAIDGHLLIVRGLLTSFEAAPLTSLSLDAMRTTMTTGVGHFLLAAVEIAAPLLAALFLAEIGLGLISRAAPQLNILMLGMPFKGLLTLTLAGLAIPLLPNGVRSLVHGVVRAGQSVTGSG